MFWIGQKVRTSKQVSKKDYAILKENNIKPGTTGEIIDIIYVVKFKNIGLKLEESSITFIDEKDFHADDSTVEYLKNMFGMK